jgi:hypothetical protein
MWSLFPKIYDDYKTLLYSSSNILNNPTEPSKKDSLPVLDCLYVQENSSKQFGKPNAPLDKKSCCMLIEKVKKDLLNKNLDINNYMIIENCSRK